MLGNACNFNCSYCPQHNSKPNITSRLNEDVFRFLNSIAVSQSDKCKIKFYGGEPLFYWSYIEKTVGVLGDKFVYRIISNGSLFDQEKIAFCNAHDIGVIISWDGRGSLQSRGYDVFDKESEILFQLDNLSIHTVFNGFSGIQNTIKDVEELDEKYYNLKKKHLYFGCDVVVPYNDFFKPIYSINFARIKTDIEFCFRHYFECNNNSVVLRAFVERYLSLYREYFFRWNGKLCLDTRRCANGIDRINLDLNGKLYACHNDKEYISDIYGDYKDYVSSLAKNDFSVKHFEKCSHCFVVSLCRGGCKVCQNEEYYCSFMKLFYGPMIKMFSDYVFLY